MLRRRAGTSSSTPDFCQLRFRGVSSYGKLIPELASSHMVLIAVFFFFLQTFCTRTPQPGPGQGAPGNENENEEKLAVTHSCASPRLFSSNRLQVYCLFCRVSYSHLVSSPISSHPLLSSPPLSSCLFSSLSVFSTSYSNLLSSSSYSLIIQTREEPFGVQVLPFPALGYTQRLTFCLSSSRPLSFCLPSFSLVSFPFHVLLSPLVSF